MRLILTYICESVRSFPKLFSRAFNFSLLNTFVQALIPLALKKFLELLSLNPDSRLLFIAGIGAYAFVLLSANIIDVAWYRSLDDFGGMYIQKLTHVLEDRIANTYGEEVERIGRQKIHHIIYNDVLDVFRVIGHHSPSLISSITIVFLSLLITAFYNTLIAIMLAGIFIVGIIIANATRKIITNASRQINSKMKSHSMVCQEFSEQIDIIQTNNILNYYKDKTEKAIENFIQTSKELDKKQVFFSNLSKHINAIFSLILAAYLSINPKNTLIDLVFIMTITSLIMNNATRIDQLYYRILSSYGAFQQVEHIRSIPQKEGMLQLFDIEMITFDNVSFGYQGAAELVLKEKSFNFVKGDCVRVNAPNGSGKSTIFKLLQGLYSPCSGSVCINGIPINKYNQMYINEEIVYIGQNDGYIDDTVREYFKLFAGKNIEDFLNHKELEIINGIDIDKKLENDGKNLSFGQRKRLQLATLLLRIDSSSLIILDELDAGLDTCGAELFYDRVNEIIEKKDKIILFVQHGENTKILHNKTLTLEPKSILKYE